VTGVEIEGAHAISAKELIARLATQPPEHRYLVVPRAQKLDQEAFENDKRRILRHYQARGYYRARIEAADILPDGAGRVRIRIRVDEGLPARVTRVEVLGLEGAPEARARLNLGIAPGNIFTEAAFDAGRVAILEALTRSGWAKATVEEHAQVDPALNEVRVAYTAKPGERYRFGSVFVSGAAAVPQTRIRSEAQRATNPGTIFDSSDLKEAQSRVFEMGVFGGVRVTEGPPDEKRHTIPVDVSVHEAPFRTIRAGPGFTLEGNVRWEADATLAWSHRNWLGGLRKLNLEGRVGYAWLPTVFNSTEQGFVGRLLADFTQPQILTRYLDLNLHGELERGIEQAYSFFAERFRMGVPFKLGRVVRFAPSLNFELYQIGGVPSATGEASSLLLATCPSQDPNLCLLAYFAQDIGLDFRNDPINTTRGVSLNLSLQEGFTLFGIGSTYLRLLPEVRGFLDLGGGFVLGARARVGLISTQGSGVPIVARFFSGGPNFMRGYYTSQLSPVFYGCPVALAKNGSCPVQQQYVPVGGEGLIDGTVELRHPIVGELGGALFFDFGDVRLEVKDALDLGKIQGAIGWGIRYRTPLGPIRVDVAGRLPSSGVQQVDPGQLSNRKLVDFVGHMHHDPIVSVQLSIGEAF